MAYFTDYFNVDEEVLEEYGAFNISLINDLPLFIDPFLLFGSEKQEYIDLHNSILRYLAFLKSKSERGNITVAEVKSWYKFSEIKQNWLGYSVTGNKGSGLGMDFGMSMSSNIHLVYNDLNKETITVSSHIEKVGLFEIGIGKDCISDFTCNLIKSYLLEYTENFAKLYLDKSQVKRIHVGKVYFNYSLERWMPKYFILPYYNNDYIILTPKDLLTKDENWINSRELKSDFTSICNSIPNDQLRREINEYFRSRLPAPQIVGKGKNRRYKRHSQKELSKAKHETIRKFPVIMNYYIKSKEENKIGAKNISQEKVVEVEQIFKENILELVSQLVEQTEFYQINPDTSYTEAMKRVEYLKDVIENKDGYRIFYYKGERIKREMYLHVIYLLTWYSSPFDVNREVNNGRGPVDFIISRGAKDKSLVEFKLASNSKLKINLQNQVKIYEKASDTEKSIKVILYFDDIEYKKTITILKELGLENDKSIVLIDAGDNKPSASTVK